MSIDMNDPRFTAYVLGEMDDVQRSAFEQEIEGDAAAAAELDELRTLTASLETELAGEAAPALQREQRAVIQAASEAPVATPSTGSGYWRLAAAAAVLVAVPMLVLTFAERDESSAVFSALEEHDSWGAPSAGSGGGGHPVEASGPVSDNTIYELKVTAMAGPEAGLLYEGEASGGVMPAPDGKPLGFQFETKTGTAARVVPMASRPATTTLNVVDGRSGESTEAGVAFGRAGQAGYGSASHNRFLAGPNKDGLALLPRIDVPGTEAYDAYRENPFTRTGDEHTSTFSIDVDTAAYANVRRFLLQNNRLPPIQAVRIEELINYFKYDYKTPADDAKHPFAAHVQIATCPWNPAHRLARIVLKGKTMETRERPATNLVFLVDVSGSMRDANKLPLAVKGLKMMLESLDERDRVGIVTYAGQASIALPSTSAGEYQRIADVISALKAGGSTNGGSGIQMAYEQAQQHFIKGGVNRVVLLTDGDFNVGISDRAGLVALIKEKAKSNVFLSVVGFGQGNLKDAQMEELSNKGNGNYAYVDGEKEAHKVFADELTGTLVTIAKDVKIQVQFNPKRVAGYRLIGYENRRLATRDFNDDRKDAGEIGAGHTVTALYELVPAGLHLPGPSIDPNPFVDGSDEDGADEDGKGKKDEAQPPLADSKALFKLRLRYKQPESLRSVLMEQFAMDEGLSFEKADDDFQWAAAVAGFGMLLRGSAHLGQTNYDAVLEIAKPLVGDDAGAHRLEFLNIVKKAKSLPK